MKYQWTMHALERMAELNKPVQYYIDALRRAQPHHLSDEQQAYKFSKYGMQSLDDVYLYDEQKRLLFTLKPMQNFYLILTVTEGLGNFC
jgi:hypothetical protein